MSATDRLSILTGSFRDHPLRCGPLELRPVTVGSIVLLIEMGNRLFAEDDADSGGDFDELASVIEFLWVHAAPIEDVLDLADDPPRRSRAIRAFGMEIELPDLRQFAEDFGQLRQRIEAAQVTDAGDTEEGGGSGEAGKPSPTGLPAWSSPSAARETPPASAGSSGACPSTARSSISTPPSSGREPACAGVSPMPVDLTAPIPLSSSAPSATSGSTPSHER